MVDGANIANLTLIVGVAAIVYGVTMSRATPLFNFPALAIVMVLPLYMVLSGKRVTRVEGAVLVVSYVVYLAALTALVSVMRGQPA